MDDPGDVCDRAMRWGMKWGLMPDDKLLAEERRRKGITVDEQASRMGVDRSDLYKALKRQLPTNSVKRQRVDDYCRKLGLSFLEQ